MSEDVKEAPKAEEVKNTPVDATMLVVYVWVLFKLNIITRIQVRDFLEIIQKGAWPPDVVKYLTDEVKKI